MADEMGWKETVPLLRELEQVFERERGEGFTLGLEPEIRLGLERELELRFKGKKAQQLFDLQNDTQLEKAVAVLSDASRYKETLAGRDWYLLIVEPLRIINDTNILFLHTIE